MGVRVEDDDDHRGETLDPENERSKTVLGFLMHKPLPINNTNNKKISIIYPSFSNFIND